MIRSPYLILSGAALVAEALEAEEIIRRGDEQRARQPVDRGGDSRRARAARAGARRPAARAVHLRRVWRARPRHQRQAADPAGPQDARRGEGRRRPADPALQRVDVRAARGPRAARSRAVRLGRRARGAGHRAAQRQRVGEAPGRGGVPHRGPARRGARHLPGARRATASWSAAITGCGSTPRAAYQVPVGREGLASAGGTFGSGIVLPLGDGTCPLGEVSRVANYLAGESAGQCGPCKLGLPSIARALAAIVDGSGGIEALDVARRAAAAVNGRGACSHPDGTTRFVLSALEVFTEDLAAHVFHSTCGRPVRGMLPLPDGPETANAKQLMVDWSRCEGHGLCAHLMPELIHLDRYRLPGHPADPGAAVAGKGRAAGRADVPGARAAPGHRPEEAGSGQGRPEDRAHPGGAAGAALRAASAAAGPSPPASRAPSVMPDTCRPRRLSFNPCGGLCRVDVVLSGVSRDGGGHRLSSSCVSCEVTQARRAVAVSFIMAWNEADGGGSARAAGRALAAFRCELHACFTARADALFELCDAVLCAPGRVTDLARLSLVPEFRRGHGALYDALGAGGSISGGCGSRSRAFRCRPGGTAGSGWRSTCPPGCGRRLPASPGRMFCHVHGRGAEPGPAGPRLALLAGVRARPGPFIVGRAAGRGADRAGRRRDGPDRRPAAGRRRPADRRRPLAAGGPARPGGDGRRLRPGPHLLAAAGPAGRGLRPAAGRAGPVPPGPAQGPLRPGTAPQAHRDPGQVRHGHHGQRRRGRPGAGGHLPRPRGRHRLAPDAPQS